MDRRKGTRQYWGRLTAAKAAKGMQAAIQNARSLVADAELLLEHKRWQRATALAILGIEEIGKISILREILLARNQEELRDGWRRYRTHTQKNLMYIVPELVRKGARKLEDLRPVVDETSDHGVILEAVKQISLYSDACGQCKWTNPGTAINTRFAKGIVSIAKMMVPNGPNPFTTEAELEIWVRHMRPVWKGPMDRMKRALVACYAEARAKGVLQSETTEHEMMNFLGEQPTFFLT